MTVSKPAPDEARFVRASQWFETLQRRIIEAMEALEREFADAGAEIAPGRFVIEPWQRLDSFRRARRRRQNGEPTRPAVREDRRPRFDRAWDFCARCARQMPGARERSPRFWASGLSVIAHPWNPNVPTAHMNTRMVVRPAKPSFGGGADLTPTLEERVARTEDPDAIVFHDGLRAACARQQRGRALRQGVQAMVRRVFLSAPSRRAARGIGGIFFDHLNSAGDARHSAFAADFAFARDVGETFLAVYDEIIPGAILRRPWSEAEREEQLVRRGRYVEFNLLYDRGTVFGLKTGGNVAAILSSLPPTARWP